VFSFAADGRTTVAGAPNGLLDTLALTTLVFLPSENPIAQKTAQTSTNVKNKASIRPVPRVISVSWDEVGMDIDLTSTF
jgi:hypothetical protein